MRKTKELGNKGETIIAGFLEKKGFKILARNYTTRLGEIDLIAAKDTTVAFIEVKARKTKYFPVSIVVTPNKQKKIIRTAKLFMLKNNLTQNKLFRFDVATVVIEEHKHTIKYIPNAFHAG